MNFRTAPFDRRTPYSDEEIFLMRVPRAGAILYKHQFAVKGQRGEERSMKRLSIRGPEMVSRSVPVAPAVESQVVSPVRPRPCPPAPKKSKSKSKSHSQPESLPARRRAPITAARKQLFEVPLAGFEVDGSNPFLLVPVVPEVVVTQPETVVAPIQTPEIIIAPIEIPEIIITPEELPETPIISSKTTIPCPSLLSPPPTFDIAAPVVIANSPVCPQAPRRKQVKPVQQRLKKDDQITKKLFTDVAMATTTTTTTGEADSTNPFA